MSTLVIRGVRIALVLGFLLIHRVYALTFIAPQLETRFRFQCHFPGHWIGPPKLSGAHFFCPIIFLSLFVQMRVDRDTNCPRDQSAGSIISAYRKTLAFVYTSAYNNIVKYSFEWDDEKNETNFEKHEVWFEEARTIWADAHGHEAFDPDHSDEEDRFVRMASRH